VTDAAAWTPRQFELHGARVLVTGAGRGIGRACTLGLAAAGAEVVALSRTSAELADVARQVERAGGRASCVVCDLLDHGALDAALDAAGPIDVLVNAAGGNVPEPFAEVAVEQLDRLLALNVKAPFLLAQAVARRLIARAAPGAIVFVSSQMGHVGAPRRSVYCTTKHAVEGMTKALAVELAPHGIRVNSVAPTFVETPMTRPFLADPAFRADVVARIPLGRIGSADEVVGAVVFAASPAAALMTGASVVVDGGWTAQ
jgi:NAD(P)-dependent dehydrogenase (short-subunit alcohol dehydrogenase family)